MKGATGRRQGVLDDLSGERNIADEVRVLPTGAVHGLATWIPQIAGGEARVNIRSHAAPGAGAWTPLSGGVPDADDTSAALVALRQLGEPDSETVTAAGAGARWLLGVQNRDGGIPTFCRGWGALPFDRSTPEITAHALRAWSSWHPHFDATLQRTLSRAAIRALMYLETTQRRDGSWVPLWFGNEHAPGEDNPVYGTARVLLGLNAGLVHDHPRASTCRRRAVEWLLDAQNDDGGWGGNRGVCSSVEETGIVLSAISRVTEDANTDRICQAVDGGVRWLINAVREVERPAAPLGLYFARLWYYEELYPVIFSVEGLARARAIRTAGALG